MVSHRTSHFLALAFSFALTCLAPSIPRAAPAGSDTVVIRPRDQGNGLSNPGMGWSFAYYANHGDQWRRNWGNAVEQGEDVLHWFPGCTTVFIRLGWSSFEPQEGVYDWSRIDWIGDKWASRGKRMAFSTIACNPYHRDTPDWVREAGARGTWIKVRPDNMESDTLRRIAPPSDASRWSWCPDYDDPVFLAKLDRFLAAAAARYDGRPHVEFVEIGSIGSWGEGHGWLSTGRIDGAVRKTHIDLWTRHFRKTTLIVNDEYGREQDGTRAPAALDYALDRGLGMADHSLQLGERGNRSPDFADKFWPTRPVLLEHHNETPFREEYYQAMLRYHASYMRINTTDSLATLPSSWEVVKRISRRMGYRFQVVEAKWPSRAVPGGKVAIELAIRNAGVAPCYKGGRVAVELTGKRGPVALAVHPFEVRELRPGPDSTLGLVSRLRFELELPSSDLEGPVDVRVSIGGPDGRPVYALPHAGDDGSRRYRLGAMRIETEVK